MKYKRPTPARQPLGEITNANVKKQIKKIIQLSKTAKEHKILKRIPVTIHTLQGEGITQHHKAFKEDQTCFNYYPMFQHTIPDCSCDNDCLTEPEQIKEARKIVINDIREAVSLVRTDKSLIKNNDAYQNLRDHSRSKRCRMI